MQRTGLIGMPRVLVIDDDPSLTELFADILGDQYEVYVAHTFVDAKQMCKAMDMDVVLSDYHLSMQNAESFFAWLAQYQQHLVSRFILLTGDDLMDLSHFQGAACILYKPVPIETLLETVAKLIASHEGG